MKNKITSLSSTFSINKEISTDDTRFLHVTIDVLHTGLNFNNSIFEKDIVDSCIESIKNTAVLGFIEYDKVTKELDFKGHEHILTKTKNGVEEKYIGSAYGVIPESCNPRWITKNCDDGVEREFLQVDALLWTKFDNSVDILNRDIVKGHSMELEISSVEGYEDDDEIFHFTNFRFDGCCILGDNKQPAMINSTIEVQFTMSEFVKNLQTELNDKFTTFTKMVNDKTNQGGIKTMPNTDFVQTVMEQFADISTMVNQAEVVKDRWGDSVPRYYLRDIQENEVIVVDRTSNYQIYGFPFTMDGDKANIDFSCGKRKKTQYVDYEEGVVAPEGSFDFGNHITEIEEAAFSKVEDANQKVSDAETKLATAEEEKTTAETNYTQVKAEYDEMKPKYDEYVQAEKVRLEAELDAQKDAEFAKYETALADCAEFEALKEKKADMTVKDIKGECAILFARKNLTQTNFSKSNTRPMVAGVIDNDTDNDGFIATKYGNIPVRR